MTPIAQRAIESWNHDVDTEMARLIERGVPPSEAARRAQDAVTRRRQAAASGAALSKAQFIIEAHKFWPGDKKA